MNEKVNFEYPSLFNSADSYSIKAQKRFISLNRWVLILLFISTILTSLSIQNWAFWVSSVILLISAIMSFLMLFLKFEKGWYEGRAVAESIKTLCWKYMIGAKPFDYKLDSKIAQANLITNFKKVIGQRKDFFELIGSNFARYEQLPKSLTEIRDLDFKQRINIYKTHRLEKQKKWYSDKVDENQKWRKISFALIISAQILALVVMIVNYKFEFNIFISPIFIAISTSLIAWLQLKKYQELSQSYLITATELSLIKSKVNQINSEEELSNFVDDAESAISREHTLWLARRDNIDLFD